MLVASVSHGHDGLCVSGAGGGRVWGNSDVRGKSSGCDSDHAIGNIHADGRGSSGFKRALCDSSGYILYPSHNVQVAREREERALL